MPFPRCAECHARDNADMGFFKEPVRKPHGIVIDLPGVHERVERSFDKRRPKTLHPIELIRDEPTSPVPGTDHLADEVLWARKRNRSAGLRKDVAQVMV